MRDWRDGSEEAVRVLTECMRTPQGRQALRPIQAVALLEAYQCRGLYLCARIGAGKTLVSGLIPTIMRPLGYTRPLILVRAKLLKKTKKEFEEARKDWKLQPFYRVESYTALTLEKNADLLSEYKPDLIICDEAQALRRDNSIRRRINRYRQENPRCLYFFMSGTFLKSRITDYSHLLAWALGEGSPLPVLEDEINNWSAAIDDADSAGLRSLEKYLGAVDSYDDAKARYRARLRGAPGVIISDDAFTGSTLIVRAIYANPGLQAEFEKLRTEYQRPDGWDLVDAKGDDGEPPDFAAAGGVWNVAQQLALEFYYTCDPQPPKSWMAARRGWFQFVRAVLAAGAGLDTPLQVQHACEAAAKPPEEWTRWAALKGTFEPNRKAVWLGRGALDYAIAWGRQSPGVVWVGHVAFGERLAQETGWRYFHEEGCDASGMMIEDAPTTETIIASIPSNFEGRNLQAWNRGLVMMMFNSAERAEQLFGRFMREGQLSPYVTFDVYVACREHANALHNLKIGAEHAYDTQGIPQQILTAQIQNIGERPTNSWAFSPSSNS